MMDARFENGQARAVGEAVTKTFGGMRIQYDQPHRPTAIPVRFDNAIAAGLLFPGYAEGTIAVEVGGRQILAEAGEPLRLGRHSVRETDRCSYEPLTPLRHHGEVPRES